MSFIRDFDSARMQRMSNINNILYERLKADIILGIVFPTVRKGEIHFYYKGGSLYKFNGISFERDSAYEK
jgi:hypothetical protein